MSEKQPTALLDPSMSPVLMIRNGEPVTLLHWCEDYHEWDVHDAVGDVDSSWRSWSLTEGDALFVAARPLVQSLCSTATLPTPAKLLLERVLGGLQVLTMEMKSLRAEIDGSHRWIIAQDSARHRVVNIGVVLEALQDEIIQLDAGQIPESIREAYEAQQATTKETP